MRPKRTLCWLVPGLYHRTGFIISDFSQETLTEGRSSFNLGDVQYFSKIGIAKRHKMNC